MADNEVQLRFRGDASGAQDAASQTSKAVNEVRDSVNEARDEIRGFKEIMIEAFSIREIAEFISKITELGEAVNRSVQMTALSSDQAQTLGFALKMTGGEADDATTSMARLERNMLQAASGTGAAYDAFQRLHISLDQIRSASPYEMVQLLADKFQQLGPSVQRTADMTAVGGRGFIQMASALSEGSEGLQSFHDQLEETGALMSPQIVTALEESHQKITLLKTAMEGTGISIVTTLKPAIDDITTSLGQLLEKFTANVKGDGLFHDILVDIADAALVVEAALKSVAYALGGLGAITYDVAHGQLSDIKNVLDDVGKSTDAAWAHIDEVMNKVATTANPNLAGATGGVGTIITQAQRDAAAKTAQQEADEEVAIDKAKFQTMEQLAGDDFQKKIALQAQWLAEAKDYYGEDSTQYQEALKEKYKLDQEYTKQTNQEYKSLFSSIGSNYDTMIQGVMLGTQTWQQALQRSFGNLAVSFAETISKMIAQWAVFSATSGAGILGFGKTNPFSSMGSLFGGGGSAAQTTAITANTTAITALTTALTGNTVASTASTVSTDANTTSNVAGLGANTVDTGVNTVAIQANTTALSASSASGGGGGFFSFLSSAGTLASFDVGTPNLPFTGPILAHQGEMILPPDISAQVRSGSAVIGSQSALSVPNSAGGGNMNVSIQAVDAQSFVNLLQTSQGQQAVVQIVNQQSRRMNTKLSATT